MNENLWIVQDGEGIYLNLIVCVCINTHTHNFGLRDYDDYDQNQKPVLWNKNLLPLTQNTVCLQYNLSHQAANSKFRAIFDKSMNEWVLC